MWYRFPACFWFVPLGAAFQAIEYGHKTSEWPFAGKLCMKIRVQTRAESRDPLEQGMTGAKHMKNSCDLMPSLSA
jgi:hypothetical protein